MTPALAVATACSGTPRLLTTDSDLGANPDRDSDSSIREVMYRLVLALDTAAEITTRFIAPAAYGMPIAAKARTNGLPVRPPPLSASSCHGPIISITAIAST